MEDSQIPKTGGFRELFLPENDFKTSSGVNFPHKKTSKILGPGNQPKSWNADLNFFLICPSTYEPKSSL